MVAAAEGTSSAQLTYLHAMSFCGVEHVCRNVPNTHISALIAIEVHRLRSSIDFVNKQATLAVVIDAIRTFISTRSTKPVRSDSLPIGSCTATS